MAQLTIDISYDGYDSTDDQDEFAGALEGIARRLRDYDWMMDVRYPVHDTNGNTIGQWEVSCGVAHGE